MTQSEQTETVCKKAFDMLMFAWKICKIAFVLLVLFGIISAIVIYSHGEYGGIKLQSTWRDVALVLFAMFLIVMIDKAARAANKAMWGMIRPGDPNKSPVSFVVKFLFGKTRQNKKDGE